MGTRTDFTVCLYGPNGYGGAVVILQTATDIRKRWKEEVEPPVVEPPSTGEAHATIVTDRARKHELQPP